MYSFCCVLTTKLSLSYITRCVWRFYTVLSRGAFWPNSVWNRCGWSSWVPLLQGTYLSSFGLCHLWGRHTQLDWRPSLLDMQQIQNVNKGFVLLRQPKSWQESWYLSVFIQCSVPVLLCAVREIVHRDVREVLHCSGTYFSSFSWCHFWRMRTLLG